MAFSIKKAFVTVVIVLALLAALVGLAARISTLPGIPYNTGLHSSSHLLADGDGDNDFDDGGTGTDAEDNWYCPPPPRWC